MVRLSEMDSGSIVFAGRTGRGGKAAGGATGVARGRVGGGEGTSGSGAGDVEVGGWKVAMGGTGVVAMAGERPAFLREIFLRRVAKSGR